MIVYYCWKCKKEYKEGPMCKKHPDLEMKPPKDFGDVYLNGASGKTERQMLQDKQKLVSKRAQLHTKNEGWKDIRNPENKERMYQKYHGKNSKFKDLKGDHDKIKY